MDNSNRSSSYHNSMSRVSGTSTNNNSNNSNSNSLSPPPLQQPIEQQQIGGLGGGGIGVGGGGTIAGGGGIAGRDPNLSRQPGALLQLIRLSGVANFRDLLINSMDNNDLSDLLSNSVFNYPQQQSATPQFASATQTKGIFGDAVFLDGHTRAVKAVDFSPQDDHVFCSASLDGLLNTYNARHAKLLNSSVVSHMGSNSFTGCKKVILTTGSGRILIYDIHRGSLVQSIEQRCVLTSTQTRIPIAVDSNNCNMFMVPNGSGRGITQVDLRQNGVVRTLDDIHDNHITDIEILEPSWARAFNVSRSNEPIVLTSSMDTTAKIIDSQKQVFKKFEMKSHVYSIAHTPDIEQPTSTSTSSPSSTPSSLRGGNIGSIAIGGDKLNIYPALHGSDSLLSTQLPCTKAIYRLKYTHAGDKLFVATNDGHLRMYHRTMYRKYENKGVVFRHGRDIQDCAISKNDEYVVTASGDHKIGLVRIGEPLFGPSECGDTIRKKKDEAPKLLALTTFQHCHVIDEQSCLERCLEYLLMTTISEATSTTIKSTFERSVFDRVFKNKYIQRQILNQIPLLPKLLHLERTQTVRKDVIYNTFFDSYYCDRRNEYLVSPYPNNFNNLYGDRNSAKDNDYYYYYICRPARTWINVNEMILYNNIRLLADKLKRYDPNMNNSQQQKEEDRLEWKPSDWRSFDDKKRGCKVLMSDWPLYSLFLEKLDGMTVLVTDKMDPTYVTYLLETSIHSSKGDVRFIKTILPPLIESLKIHNQPSDHPQSLWKAIFTESPEEGQQDAASDNIYRDIFSKIFHQVLDYGYVDVLEYLLDTLYNTGGFDPFFDMDEAQDKEFQHRAVRQALIHSEPHLYRFLCSAHPDWIAAYFKEPNSWHVFFGDITTIQKLLLVMEKQKRIEKIPSDCKNNCQLVLEFIENYKYYKHLDFNKQYNIISLILQYRYCNITYTSDNNINLRLLGKSFKEIYSKKLITLNNQNNINNININNNNNNIDNNMEIDDLKNNNNNNQEELEKIFKLFKIYTKLSQFEMESMEGLIRDAIYLGSTAFLLTLLSGLSKIAINLVKYITLYCQDVETIKRCILYSVEDPKEMYQVLVFILEKCDSASKRDELAIWLFECYPAVNIFFSEIPGAMTSPLTAKLLSVMYKTRNSHLSLARIIGHIDDVQVLKIMKANTLGTWDQHIGLLDQIKHSLLTQNLECFEFLMDLAPELPTYFNVHVYSHYYNMAICFNIDPIFVDILGKKLNNPSDSLSLFTFYRMGMYGNYGLLLRSKEEKPHCFNSALISFTEGLIKYNEPKFWKSFVYYHHLADRDEETSNSPPPLNYHQMSSVLIDYNLVFGLAIICARFNLLQISWSVENSSSSSSLSSMGSSTNISLIPPNPYFLPTYLGLGIPNVGIAPNSYYSLGLPNLVPPNVVGIGLPNLMAPNATNKWLHMAYSHSRDKVVDWLKSIIPNDDQQSQQ
ncbi:hypothetical protein DFA_05590 [Cavenderia fasciculata]|uniref:WD40 repeat-containing protein n=1 Tax=Cavenderia fasciculata TaxID=261658 RepID=F4PLN5_CACFS|nr:uncharacterized protein DFA_05590 [Cavenderia fasciculata]EGG23457.1 hypothetical protein DFA_05590 [Cavenderia fasciculata]|eukprot:XP_004361308.1 hypothetical protein DFA_05590 [Cavenderia fasciculata]